MKKFWNIIDFFKEKEVKKYLKNFITNKYTIFCISFFVMFIYLLQIENFFDSSMDSYETWEVVKTFFSDNKHISYVMYKGIYTFIPGVICYTLSNLFNTPEFFFLKIFHSISFAYITTIGIPFLLKYLFKNEVKVWQKYLYIILFFLLEYNLFTFISVDFMSLCLLLLSTNSIIKIKEKKKIKIYNYLICGGLLGICSCLSGQYSLSTYMLIIYTVYIIIKDKKYKSFFKKTLILSYLIIGLSCTVGLNKYYEYSVVEPAREQGEWLPTGSDWIQTGFTSNMLIINYPYSLTDNLGKKIIEYENLDTDIIGAGGLSFDNKMMLRTILKYPTIFIIRWIERFFLGILNDPYNYYPGNTIVSVNIFLCVMGTVIYMTLYSLKYIFKKVKDIFTLKGLILLSFIFVAIVPSYTHVENRYYFGLRTLMLGIVIFSPIIENIKETLLRTFKKTKNTRGLAINYNILSYIIFIALIFILYIAIYQSGNQIFIK